MPPGTTTGYGGAAAPPPPDRTESDVTTAAGPLLALSDSVQAREFAKQAEAHQQAINTLPDNANWMPDVPRKGGAGGLGADEPTEAPAPAPATPSAAAGRPASPPPPSRGASLDDVGRRPQLQTEPRSYDNYKEAPELLVTPPGGQVGACARLTTVF
jgi:hypothetical protein